QEGLRGAGQSTGEGAVPRVSVPGHGSACGLGDHQGGRRAVARHRPQWSDRVNLATMLYDVAEEHGDREALVDGATRLDFRAVLGRAKAIAAGLDVEPGDRVAILLPNGWHYAVSYFGVQLAGAVAVLVNTRLAAPEIEYVLRDSGARLVIT